MRTIYPSRIKRDFETYGTDHENEVIEIFVLTLGSIRGGRFQFKQTVLWNEGTLNWPNILHILTERLQKCTAMSWMYFSQWKLHSNGIIFQLQFAKKLSHFTSCDKIVTKTNCNEIWWIIIFFFFYMQGYQNCSCFVTQSNEGIEGSGCQPECNNLAPFLFCLFGLMVFTFSNNIPATTATLRYNLWFLKK